MNPELAEFAAAADAARERIVSAGALPDPRISYEASNLPTGTLDFASTPMSGNQFGLRQMLPFPGVLRNRAEAAERASRATTFELADRHRSVESGVEAAWAEVGFAQRALAITDRNLELLQQLTKIAETRYAVGSGLQQDVLRAQVELTALLDERLTRDAAVARTVARLAAILDLPPETAIPPTATLEDPTPPPELVPLLARVVVANPLLKALAEKVEERRHAVRVAELEGYPDVDVGLGYRIRQRVPGDPVAGDDFLSAGLTIRLPVNRTRWRAQVADQRAQLRAAEARLRKLEAALIAQVRVSHADLVRADSEAELLRTGLVPQAQQSFESSRSAYEVGRIEFQGLLDSQVRLLNAELRAARALAERRVAFAALRSAVGEDLR